METKEAYKKTLSYKLLMTTFLLCSIGILANYSASALKSYDLFGSPYLFLYKQIFGVALGFLFIFLLQKMPTSVIERAPLPFFLPYKLAPCSCFCSWTLPHCWRSCPLDKTWSCVAATSRACKSFSCFFTC